MDGGYRVSDGDREAVVTLLRAHQRAGRISVTELLARSAAAREAVTGTDLAALLRDLPDDTEPGRRGWQDRGWRTHAAVAALTVGGVLGVWQVTRDKTPEPKDYGADYWWPLWFGLFWAVAVLLHYLYAAGLVRLPNRTGKPAEEAEESAELGGLTAREREILSLVGEGCSNKEIARRLYISERTARTHVSNILRKLGLSSRTQAALVAVKAGLVPRNGGGAPLDEQAGGGQGGG